MWKRFKTGQVIDMDNIKTFFVKKDIPNGAPILLWQQTDDEYYLKMFAPAQGDKKVYAVRCTLGDQGGEVLLDVFNTSEEAQAYIGDLLKEMGADLQ